jgi:ABC-2 type transport system ATP-binding protein
VNAIEATGIGKRYRDRDALVDLTFTAAPGEIVGLLGPNGAGKTTAIRVLTTILRPTTGTFAIAGAGHDRPAQIRRRIGVLPESAGYPVHQTGREYLRYFARLHAAPVERVDPLLAEVGLAERASSRVGSYSRGMRQRLGIARALINDPAVVFLDEPTVGLDPAGQRQVLDLVRAAATRRHSAVVFSSHSLIEVENLCTHVLILHEGRVRAAGPVTDVVAARGASNLSDAFWAIVDPERTS